MPKRPKAKTQRQPRTATSAIRWHGAEPLSPAEARRLQQDLAGLADEVEPLSAEESKKVWESFRPSANAKPEATCRVRRMIFGPGYYTLALADGRVEHIDTQEALEDGDKVIAVADGIARTGHVICRKGDEARGVLRLQLLDGKRVVVERPARPRTRAWAMSYYGSEDAFVGRVLTCNPLDATVTAAPRHGRHAFWVRKGGERLLCDPERELALGQRVGVHFGDRSAVVGIVERVTPKSVSIRACGTVFKNPLPDQRVGRVVGCYTPVA